MPVKIDGEALAPGEARAHRGERLLQGGAHLGVALAAGREALLQQAGDGALVAARELGGGGEALRAVGRRDQDRRAHPLELALQPGIGLGGERLLDQRQLRLVERRLGELVDRAAAHADVGRQDAQAGERRLERAARAVVVGDVLGAFGQRRGGAARGVGRLAVVDDEDLVAGDLDLVVEQRLHEGGEALVAARDRRVQRGDARIVLAGGDRQRLLRGEREGARRQKRKDQHPRREKKNTGCHPERSEGSHQGRRLEILRFAQDDISWRTRAVNVTSSRARPSCPCSRG